jgi:hypothetical protein
MKCLVLILFVISSLSHAQMTTAPQENEKQSKKVNFNSQELRATSTGSVMVGYQLVTSWLPSKKTFGYTHFFNEKWTLEGEYSFATIDSPFIGVDLGEIKERRYTLHARRYVSNSFHFTFGFVLSDFSAEVGNEIINSFGAGITSSFSAQNLGITAGVANRWQWKNGLTLGVDWIRLNVPVVELGVRDDILDDITGSDREDIKDVISTFNKIPTFVLFGLTLGYSF